MKFLHVAVVAVLCGFAASASAQNFLQNPGFETWNGNLPASWITDTASVTKSATVHSGSSALRLNVYSYLGLVLFPGNMIQRVPVTGSSFSLKGWYQLKSDTGDGVFVSVLMQKGSQLAGAGSESFSVAHSVYTAFAFGLSMIPDISADTAIISIFMETGESQTELHLGSYALFDDLVLDNTVTGVSQQTYTHPSEYQLSQNYPNPFNPATEIEFTIPNENHVTLKVYNMMGQEIETLVDEELSQGRYKRAFNASLLSSGMYFYRLQAGNFAEVRRMALVK